MNLEPTQIQQTDPETTQQTQSSQTESTQTLTQQEVDGEQSRAATLLNFRLTDSPPFFLL